MKYSIIMPSFCNTDQHVVVAAECIESVLATRGHDSEFIIIDDGSRLKTDFLELAADTFIKHKTNQGIPMSWNDGIRVARGEFVVVINDDIIVQPGWLDKLRMALEDDHSNMVSAPGVEGKANGTGIEEDYKWFPGYCFMMHRSTFDTLGFFDEEFSPFNYEDTDMWTRILDLGCKLVRNYSTQIRHKEGHVLHTLDYDAISTANHEKFVEKWHFDPIPVFYGDKEFPNL